MCSRNSEKSHKINGKSISENEKKEEGSKLTTGLKIAASAGILVGVTWAIQKAYRRHHRKKFMKIFLKYIADETKNIQERIRELTKYSPWSREAEWIFQELRNIRRAFKNLKDSDRFDEDFDAWLRNYGYARKVPVDQMSKILRWNLDKMADFGQ